MKSLASFSTHDGTRLSLFVTKVFLNQSLIVLDVCGESLDDRAARIPGRYFFNKRTVRALTSSLQHSESKDTSSKDVSNKMAS